VTLRPAAIGDMEALWAWRNDPATREASLDNRPIPWEGHASWFQDTLASEDRLILIGEETARGRVGMVRFDIDARGDAAVSINLDPASRGMGLGTALLRAAIEWASCTIPGATLHAVVRLSNNASLALFTNCGFAEVSREGPVAKLELVLVRDRQAGT